MAAQADAQLQKFLDETLEYAAYQRDIADLAFHEVLDDHKLDVAMVKEDGLAELNRVFDEKLDEYTDIAAEMVDDMGQRAEEVCADVCKKLDKLASKERLRREDEVLRVSRERLGERNWDAQRNRSGARRQRAISLPL